MEDKLLKKGEEYRKEHGMSDENCLKLFENLRISDKKQIMSQEDKERGKNGIAGQAETLLSSKKEMKK